MSTAELTFDSGLRSTDVTPADIRESLGLPNIVERQVVYGKSGDWRMSGKHKALVNEETGQLYGIHSSSYRTVTHEEGILAVTRSLEEVPDHGPITWTIQQHDDHRRMFATARLTGRREELQKGDLIDPVVNYLNSYDGSWGEKLNLGALRLVCTNGMTVQEIFHRSSAPHLGEKRPDEFFTHIASGFQAFAPQMQAWRVWVDRPLEIGHVESTIVGLKLNDRERVKVLDEVGDGESMDLWGYFNVLTALITHDMGSLNRRVQSMGRLRGITSNWR